MERSFIFGWGDVMRRQLPSGVIARARHLRDTQTDAEGLLWWKLRVLNRRGFHFRRQAPFRGYYLDFVEHSARVVIELDGSQHGLSVRGKHDEVRDGVLVREGYLILRFSNVEVFKELERVVENIFRDAENRRPHPKRFRVSTSPQGGGD